MTVIMTSTLLLIILLLLSQQAVLVTGLSYINYFAYGSNLNRELLQQRTTPSTILIPGNSVGNSYGNSPVIPKPVRVFLPNYSLKFNVGFQNGPCAASVEPCYGNSYDNSYNNRNTYVVNNAKSSYSNSNGNSYGNGASASYINSNSNSINNTNSNIINGLPCVHGLVYQLTLQQFLLLLATEGVPIAYKLIRVRTINYEKPTREIISYTLQSGNSYEGKPSKRYINLIRKGAKEQDLDYEYQNYLSTIESF